MKTRNKVIFLVLSMVICIGLVVSSCTGGTTTRGWAGGAVSDGKLFVASMNGKLIAIDAGTGTILGKPVQLLVQTSGGLGLGCLPSACGGQSSAPVTIYASPAVQGQIVFVAGTDGKIYGYTFADNALRSEAEWIYPRQGTMSGVIIGGIVVANDRVYFGTSDGTIYALNANGLYKEWTYNIGAKIWSAPMIDGDTLYIGSLNKKVYALNASNGTKKWEYETGGAISSTPAVYDNKVFIGDYDRYFYALDKTSGTPVWKYPSDGNAVDNPQNWFWAKPIILNGVIYAPCLDGNVYALDAMTGKLVFKYELGDSISSSPVAIGNSIIVATTDLYKKTGKVYLLNTQDKNQRELDAFAEGISAPLFTNGDVVYIHTSKDNLYGINIQTKTRQTFSLSTVN